jgi:HK97 family phage major capsid protein
MPVKYRSIKRTSAVVDEEQYQAAAEQWREGKAGSGGWSLNLKYRSKSGLSESDSGLNGATFESSGQYDGIVSPDYSDGIVAPASRPLVLAQVLRNEETSSNLVRIVRSNQDTDGIGAGQTAEGAAYVESDETVTPRDYALVDTTTIFPVTEDFMMDVPSALSYITKRCGYLVQRAEENNLINGTGTPPQMQGLVNASDSSGESVTTVSSWASPALIATSVANLIAATYDASGCDPEWVLASADTWAAYATQSVAGSGSGQYAAGYPNTPGRTMWGLPVVLTANSALDNQIIVGSGAAVGRWVHTGGVKVDVSPGYSTYFGSGLVGIRAKIRSTIAYEHPSGIGILSTTSGNF